MKNISKILSVALFSLLIQGCATGLMQSSQTGIIAPPGDDKATIVFMRSSFIASAVGVEIFEINEGELEFVGALPNGCKIAHKTDTGQKVYMAYGTAADFMIANVEGNKTYYSIVG